MEGIYGWCENKRAYGWHMNGTMSEYLIAEEVNCCPLPEQLPFEDAAFMACSAGTAYSALKKLSNTVFNGYLAIVGLGPIGIVASLIAMAKRWQIISFDLSKDRVEFAKQLGINAFCSENDMPIAKQVKSRMQGKCPMLVLDTSGHPEGLVNAIAICENGAHVVTIGKGRRTYQMSSDFNISELVVKQINLQGSWVFTLPEYYELLEFMLDNKLSLVMDAGLSFIDTNANADNWFLQIEAFDPHEPFFAPEEFRKLYPDNYIGPHFDWPDYTSVTETQEQIDHVRNEYCALLTMCDHTLGRLIDKLDELNLWMDTMLIVNTDHGFLLSEHDYWAKCMMPFYNEISHIPMFIWDPRLKISNERRSSLIQTIDLAPTILNYFNVPIPKDMTGKVLDNVILKDNAVRDAAIFGIHGGHVNCTDGHYVYMRAPVSADNQPLYNYTLMPTHMRNRFSVRDLHDMELAEPFSFTKGCKILKIASKGIPELDFSSYKFGTLLYDTFNDPYQLNPIKNSEIESKMIQKMCAVMEENDCPTEQYERLGLK